MGNEILRTAVAAPGDLTKSEMREMYYKMLLIRSFEKLARELFQRDLIRGTTHTYVGEEAIAVGACAALEPGDFITSTHRGHGHCLAKGGDPKRMMAELLGRSGGYCRGKGGSMHIADVELGILGANGIVGGSIAIATGAGFTSDYLCSGAVSVCFFGDGAINQGAFAESANMAALWRLPVIYLCEENQYAEFSPARRTRPVQDLSLHAVPFGFPGITVDGNDVLAVYTAVAEAAARARRGEGPTLIVAQTYRREGHHVGDSADYRDSEEVADAARRDPLERFTLVLLRDGALQEEEAAKLAEAAHEEIMSAIEHALASEPPSADDLLDHVLAE